MATDEGGGASRTTQPAQGSSAATDVSLREHLAQRLHETERRLDDRFRDLREADWRFMEERDRRYAEVTAEREKALKIKETADLAALGLAREIQTYKDEKANELRSQIERERVTYATKDDLSAVVSKLDITIKPLAQYVTQEQGRHQGVGVTANVVAVVLSFALTVTGLVTAIYFATH